MDKNDDDKLNSLPPNGGGGDKADSGKCGDDELKLCALSIAFDVSELENINVDLGVESDCVGGVTVTGDTDCGGGGIVDSLRMISTNNMLTGKRMSKHA